PRYWAKTTRSTNGPDQPGISVFGHCLNVGVVAEAILCSLSPRIASLLPPGTALLAALHDIGKITLGFQAKCPAWFAAQPFDSETRKDIAYSCPDHALVGQYHLQELLRKTRAHGWAVAIGAHHGRAKGRTLHPPREALAEWAIAHRDQVTAELLAIFGPPPAQGPSKFPDGRDDPALWLLAGLVTVADWIGSNEVFFSPEAHGTPDEARAHAKDALRRIGWPGGSLVSRPFAEVFGFPPNPLQSAVLSRIKAPALVVIEAPMGRGKTEAALALAHSLITGGHHHGIYFALPTQVTSNRIHLRVADFLRQTLADDAHLRLAHGSSWLEDTADLKLEPSYTAGPFSDDENPRATVEEARSWFASAKQALLATYGVGTIDQALLGMVAVKHFFVRRFALAGKVVVLDEVHSYDVYTGSLVTALTRELRLLDCTVIVLSATLTAARRRELLAAVGTKESTAANAYPLVSLTRDDGSVEHITLPSAEETTVSLRAATITEEETIAELVTRAEQGQHVLWIRNTVVEAQEAFRWVRGETPVASAPHEQIALGLLHSRFPLHRRQQLEALWLGRLGKHRSAGGPGSILIATQVVEQSVDIDLDFIVSDLAPSDMLLQRLGRLWRHPRGARAAAQPEFWVRLPAMSATEPKQLKRQLGRSSRVYAPWVLLRSASVLAARTTITLPTDIRPLLESTYAAPRPDEPAAWQELHEDLEREKQQLALNAAAAMRVLGRPAAEDDGAEALTRRAGAPTTDTLLLAAAELQPDGTTRLTALDGTTHTVSDFQWSMATARFLHLWIVRAPRWWIPPESPRPRWLGLHARNAVLALVGEDGRLGLGDEPASTAYHPDLGLFSNPNTPTRQTNRHESDDDEFDY
ncbi:MAG TPA: CRISPR-associated helicase Cas3', partial [Acidobacteriota bacterium]|nr:CRISPR-associated helicase Cas3' [Acidobacteriota bacterium]